MPSSTRTTSRSARTTRTEQTRRTTATRHSLLSSFTKSLRPISEPTPFFTPAHSLERTLSADEERLVRQVIGFLDPTVLYPFQNFKRPWPRENNHHPDDHIMSLDWAVAERRLVQLVSDFIDELPQLLSFESVEDQPSPEAALVESMQLRRTGHAYDAVCLLQKTMITSASSVDILRLHQRDILTQLNLRSTVSVSADDCKHLLLEEGPISAALLMFAYANHLFQRLPSNELVETAVFAQVSDRMLGAPWTGDGANEQYAKICYAHTYITSARFVRVIEGASGQSSLRSSDEALARLLELWHRLNAGPNMEQADFLRWRCGHALNECLPFPDHKLGLPDRLDALSTLGAASQLGLHKVFALLQAWWNGGPVEKHHLSTLASCVEEVIGRKDTRQLDEVLQAIRLIDHPDLTSLRKALLIQGWRLHREVLPQSSWVLDHGLQHALHLWVAAREKEGAFCRVQGSDSSPPSSPSEQSRSLSHLCFGFGELASKQACRKWVYSWSILYQCLQHTSSPSRDRLYSFLFADNDLFSWSQLCQRLRFICRDRVVCGYDSEDLIIDGVTPQHSNLAGLDTLQLALFGEDPLTKLKQKTAGLRRLRQTALGLAQAHASSSSDEPNILDERMGSDLDGLKHLAALSLAWIGLARLDCAYRLFDKIKTSETPSTVSSETLTELLAARDELQQAFHEGRQLGYGLVLRQAGDGLLDLHDCLYDCEQRFSNHTHRNSKVTSRLTLCEQLQTDLRFSVVQNFATRGYRFVAGDHCVSTKTPLHAVTKLYQTIQTSLYSEEKLREAAAWSQNESDDAALGEEMAVMNPVREERHWVSGDGEIAMNVVQNPTEEQQRDYLAKTIMPLAPSPTPNQIGPTADVKKLIRVIPKTAGAAKVIQFGCKDEQIIVYATDTRGRLRHSDCDMTRARLISLSDFRAITTIQTNDVLAFRQLDTLADSIVSLTAPDELLILIPGLLCRGVPFQVLEARQGAERVTLSERNPIIYAPTPSMVQRCIERGVDSKSAAKRQRRVAAAGVFWSESQSQATRILDTARYVASELKGTAIIEEAVTLKRICEEIQQREWFFFLGHGFGGVDPDNTLTLPYLILRGNPNIGQDERFTQYHLANCTLADTCLVLLGCDFGRVRESEGVEYESLALTSLHAGSLATVGTMFRIPTSAAEALGKRLADKLKPLLTQSNATTIFRIARILQESATEMRKEGMGPNKWGAFVVHGTPVLLIGCRTSRSSS